MSRSDTAPFWEQANFAPVHEEMTAFDLPVEGSIPPELRGLYARNGANPRRGHSGHWFMGRWDAAWRVAPPRPCRMVSQSLSPHATVCGRAETAGRHP
jgi:hypothetical protein